MNARTPVVLVAAAFLVAAAGVTVHANGNGCPPLVTPLLAGQTINVGTVTITNDGDELCIKYEVDDPWYLTETHIYVGTEMPETGAPGQFPLGDDDLPNVTEYEECIPLDEAWEDGQLLYIAAHAVVCSPGDCDPTPASASKTVPLLDNGATVGNVTASIEGENLVVEVTASGYELILAELKAAGATCNPPLPIVATHEPGGANNWDGFVSHTFVIPLASLSNADGSPIGCDDTIIMSVRAPYVAPGTPPYHFADIIGQSYSQGESPLCGFTLVVPCDECDEECETAWGFGPIELRSFLNSNKWGWLIEYVLCLANGEGIGS
jgi:hypothetical protein